MSSATDSRWQMIKLLFLSFLFASGLWYMVIGSAQIEDMVELRVDYRSLPAGLVVRDGMVHKISVRLRGPSELLRGLHARDLVYSVDLSGVQRGANAVPINVDSLLELKAYEMLDVSPSRLVLEIDALIERVLPLEPIIAPLPENSSLRLTNVLLEPSFVTVKGPESLVRPLEQLTINFDPTQDSVEGTRAVSLAIAAPQQVDISPPVTTLRYTLALKTETLEVQRVVQLDADDRSAFSVEPSRVSLTVEVPEGRVKDAEYQAAIRVVVRPPESLVVGASADMPVLVVLPAGARLVRVAPSEISIVRLAPAPTAIPSVIPSVVPSALPAGEPSGALDTQNKRPSVSPPSRTTMQDITGAARGIDIR